MLSSCAQSRACDAHVVDSPCQRQLHHSSTLSLRGHALVHLPQHLPLLQPCKGSAAAWTPYSYYFYVERLGIALKADAACCQGLYTGSLPQCNCAKTVWSARRAAFCNKNLYTASLWETSLERPNLCPESAMYAFGVQPSTSNHCDLDTSIQIQSSGQQKPSITLEQVS